MAILTQESHPSLNYSAMNLSWKRLILRGCMQCISYPTYDNSTYHNPTYHNPTYDNSTYDNSTYDNSTYDNPAYDNSTCMYTTIRPTCQVDAADTQELHAPFLSWRWHLALRKVRQGKTRGSGDLSRSKKTFKFRSPNNKKLFLSAITLEITDLW